MLRRIKKHKWLLIALAVLGVVYFYALPDPLFDDPYSTVLLDRTGKLLSAEVAHDGQWRFPENGFVPDKLRAATCMFEDRRFYQHPGVDLLSVGRATLQNLRAGKVVSGASTISMQVVRLSRKDKDRTLFEKLIEMILATRLELKYSKDKILSLYTSHAPYGGNVVGIEAASWRYFGRELQDLSWAEAALLAVLPNSPSSLHLSRRRELLIRKRNQLLERLGAAGYFDETTLNLAREEPLPLAPMSLPQLAPHLLHRLAHDGHQEQKVQSTLEAGIQNRATRVLDDHLKRLRASQIFNASAIIAEVGSGEIIAYIGNTNSGAAHEDQVDVIQAPRSTGSILKPFLYAALLDEGKLLPTSLVSDVPTVIDGFAPKNFSHDYDGAVPADQALIRSLNIPAVLELKAYRYERFYELLKRLGLTTLTRPPDHYGLSLVLGGAEGTLFDITGAYASMARSLNNYFVRGGGKNRYDELDIHPLSYLHQESAAVANLRVSGCLSAAAIWQTFDVLKELYRPGEETGWKHFSSSRKIAWKTGTSFGFRDGWAIGLNSRYIVGVWVGNADGEGRPGLTGSAMAAPILFDLFSSLEGDSWFQKPESEMQPIEICTKSGQRASLNCPDRKQANVPEGGLQSEVCAFHRLVHLTQAGKYQVNAGCAPMDSIHTEAWFVLPPVEGYYYGRKNLSYRPLPPYAPGCQDPSYIPTLDILYPKEGSSIFVPREIDGTPGQALFRAVHRSQHATVYWHLDGNYLGVTSNYHQFAYAPGIGRHTLVVMDDQGQSSTRSFKVISKP